MKRCHKCDRLLPDSEFHKDKTRKDGLQDQCKECKAAYYQDNREEFLEKHAQYRRANSGKRVAYSKKYEREHPEWTREKRKKWAKRHPEVVRAIAERRRARKNNLPATLTEQEWQLILHRFNYGCAYCGNNDEPLQQEHVIPVSKGGGYTKENIVPACPDCNRRKWTKTLEEAGMTFVN